MAKFLLYGAYGYTGTLIAEQAREYQLEPILAGRNTQKLSALAERLGYEYRAFDLRETVKLDAALSEVEVVLHAAGPFAHTAAPMHAACIRTGTHYLDITGEIPAFARAQVQGEAAGEAGIMLLPGVGFDVVPTDCLALHLKEELPDATHLQLAFAWRGGMLSHGTAKTMLEGLGLPGAVRQDSQITPVEPAYKTETFPFAEDKSLKAVTILWGDVFTAYYTTGIPNIETYMAAPPTQIRTMKASRYLGFLLRSRTLKSFLRRRIEARPAGPDAARRGRAETFVYGRVRNAAGNTYAARLRTPEGYKLTAMTALEITRRVLNGEVQPGFRTPAELFGADFVLGFAGVEGFHHVPTEGD